MRGAPRGRATIAAAPRADQAKIAEADRWGEGFDLRAIALRPRDAVVVATQGRRDREALNAALRSPAGHVGMVGRRAKLRKLLEQLSEVPEDLRRWLHAIEPAEIALSILSEIVQELRRPQRAARPELPDS